MGVIQVTLFDCWRVGNGGNVLTAMLDQQTNPKVSHPLQFLLESNNSIERPTQKGENYFSEKVVKVVNLRQLTRRQKWTVVVTRRFFSC